MKCMKALFNTSLLLISAVLFNFKLRKNPQDRTKWLRYSNLVSSNWVKEFQRKTKYSKFAELYEFEYGNFCLSFHI